MIHIYQDPQQGLSDPRAEVWHVLDTRDAKRFTARELVFSAAHATGRVNPNRPPPKVWIEVDTTKAFCIEGFDAAGRPLFKLET